MIVLTLRANESVSLPVPVDVIRIDIVTGRVLGVTLRQQHPRVVVAEDVRVTVLG